MGLSIKNVATVNKVRRLAKLRRKGLTEVVDEAISHELQRLQPAEGKRRLDVTTVLRRIQKDYAAGRPAATVEAAIVLESRRPATGRVALDRLVTSLAFEVVAFDADQLALARDGFRRYGRGRPSKARLNFGDCCAYALAKAHGEPLLFVGDDFVHTDIVPAA